MPPLFAVYTYNIILAGYLHRDDFYETKLCMLRRAGWGLAFQVVAESSGSLACT